MTKTNSKTAGQQKLAAAGPESRSPARIELYDRLLQEHGKIRDLIARVEKSSSTQVDARKELFTRLEQELQVHMEGEERFLYTALEHSDHARPRVLEGFEQHRVIKSVIGSFNSLAVDDERWPAKFKVLTQQVVRHLEDEEGVLFKMGRELLDPVQHDDIVSRLKELRREARKPRTESTDAA